MCKYVSFVGEKAARIKLKKIFIQSSFFQQLCGICVPQKDKPRYLQGKPLRTNVALLLVWLFTRAGSYQRFLSFPQRKKSKYAEASVCFSVHQEFVLCGIFDLKENKVTIVEIILEIFSTIVTPLLPSLYRNIAIT